MAQFSHHNKQLYAKYSVNDFDQYHCVTVSWWLYLSILWILRGYLVWIISVTNMQDHVAIISYLYPDVHQFYVALIAGAVGFIPAVALLLRKPNAARWVKQYWRKIKHWLISLIVIHTLMSLYLQWQWQILSTQHEIGEIAISCLLILAILRSQRLTINSIEFPEKIDEKTH